MKTVASSGSFLLASVSTLALSFVTVSSAGAGTVALITFDEVVTGSTSYGFDGDGDTVNDVIFTTTDTSGFNTIGPGANQTYIQEPGLEGTSLLNPDLRIEFLRGATESLSFGFALNSAVENESYSAGIAVYDSSDQLIGFQAEVGRYTSTSFGTSSFPEGQVSVGFSGTASYAELYFESQFGRYIIDNFQGNFGSDAVPEQLSFTRSREYNITTNNPGFREDQPTIIITHGRQPDGEYTGSIDAVPRLQEAFDAIEAEYGEDVNIIAVTWEGAFFDTEVAGLGFEDFTMVSDAERAGRALGAELSFLFEQVNYDEPIHFIGHSYGTVVNREAALRLAADDINVAQFTLLDAPVDAPITGPDVEGGLLPLIRNDGIEYIESYYGTRPTGGNVLGGPIDNTARNDGYVYDADHSGVFDEYNDTIPSKSIVEARGGFYLSPAIDGFSFLRPDDGRGLLDPLLSASILEDSILASLASSYDPILGIGTVATASDGFLVFETLLPENALAVSFNLIFDQVGSGDFLELQFGDALLGVFDGDAYQRETNVIVDVLGLGGQRDFLSFFLVNVGSEPSSLRFSDFKVLSVPSIHDVAPVPLPAGLPLLLGSIALLGGLRAQQRRSAKQ